jgi:hypothetical protein
MATFYPGQLTCELNDPEPYLWVIIEVQDNIPGILNAASMCYRSPYEINYSTVDLTKEIIVWHPMQT